MSAHPSIDAIKSPSLGFGWIRRESAEHVEQVLRAELSDYKKALQIANESADDQMWQKRQAETERDALRAELERERMRLAACGVVANANTTDSAVAARDMHPDYWSASCGDVSRAVDREIALRAEVEQLKAELARKGAK